MAILISVEQVPSLDRVAHGYLKLVPSSSFWTFVIISALMLFGLLVIIMLLYVLTLFHKPLLCLRVYLLLTS